MRARILLCEVLTAGGTLLAVQARAQDLPDSLFVAQDAFRQPGVVDPLSPDPAVDLAPVGVRLGSYQLDASVETAALFNSNVRVRATGDDDVGGQLSTRIRLRSLDSDNPTEAYVAASSTAYPSRSTETVGVLTGGINLTRELSYTARVYARAEGGHYYEDRALSFQPSLSYEPVTYNAVNGAAGGVLNIGRIVIAPEARFNRLAYQDGRLFTDPRLPLNQRVRSLWRVEPSLVIGYVVSAKTALYGGIDYNRRDYDINRALNSNGYAAYGGVRVRPTALTRLDVAIGYQKQYYRPFATNADGVRQLLTDPKGLYLRVAGLYSPDRLTWIELAYRRDISETGGVQVGGLTRDRASASVQRDVLRNLRLSASVELRRYKFASISRRDERWMLDAAATFVMSRRIDLFVRGDYLASSTVGGGPTSYDYDRAILRGGVNLKL